MEIIDANVRKEILNFNGSIVVSASAGSGKTTIMVEKIKKKVNEILDHKTVAAITFTVKATEEIKKKANLLGINKEFIVMTNDSFVEYEIIRPFLSDAYGRDYQKSFIISYDISDRFVSFDQGMKLLIEQNKLGTYRNKHNNFKFELARNVLSRSQAAREYIQSKYVSLFLDEYQDSDMNMHELFMYIKNMLKIDLFIVGDTKQAIYLWRGAHRDIFSLLKDEKMQFFELVTNFRSDFEIVNYANLLHNPLQFKIYEKNVNCVVHCITNNYIDSIVHLLEKGELDANKSITIISNINSEAQSIANDLNERGYNFIFIPKTPIDDSIDHSSILRVICCYILDPKYSVYDITSLLRIEQTRTVLNKIENILKQITQLIPLSVDTSKSEIRKPFFDILNKFSEFFSLNIGASDIELLLDTLTNEMFYPAFTESDDLYKVMTVFGAKGLEFYQVISFSKYYNFNDEGRKNNHYVCITRAEKKIVMIEDGEYTRNIKLIAQEMGILKKENLFKLIDHT